ncbi:MAG: hypothetical protein ACR2PF_06840, partial [Rhizobiaceae bacterium]
VTLTRHSGDQTVQTGLRKNAHLLFPWLYDFASSEAVLDPVAEISGPDILIWSAGFFVKDMSAPAYISWHQDSTY